MTIETKEIIDYTDDEVLAKMMSRTTPFLNRKTFLVSTPTTKDISRFEVAYFQNSRLENLKRIGK